MATRKLGKRVRSGAGNDRPGQVRDANLQSAAVSEAEIIDLADQLAEWGAALDPKQKALLAILLARASSPKPVPEKGLLEAVHPTGKLRDAARSALRPYIGLRVSTEGLVADWRKGWMQIGEPWIMSYP